MAESAAVRLERARSALALAEQQVGVASARLRIVPDAGSVAPAGAPVSAPDAWEIPASLSSLFPDGLVKGMTVGVRGSRLASLILASIPSSQGAWTACVGIADMGWICASRLGMDLERTVLVARESGPAMGQVLAAAIDGFDVVVVGEEIRLDARERRLLARRALARGVLVIAEGWPVRRMVEARYLGSQGLRAGSGHLSKVSLELSVKRTRAVRAQVGAQGWSAAGMLEAVAP